MTAVDPFADVVADTAVEEAAFDAPPPAPAKKVPAKKPAPKEVTEVGSDGKLTVTLKGGSGFDAPWIVIHAADIADAYLQFEGDNAALLVELMGKVKKAGTFFSGGDGNSRGGGRPAPAQAQQPPAGAPECPAGWEYKTGVSKASGKPWKGFFPPRGSEDKPIFFN